MDVFHHGSRCTDGRFYREIRMLWKKNSIYKYVGAPPEAWPGPGWSLLPNPDKCRRSGSQEGHPTSNQGPTKCANGLMQR